MALSFKNLRSNRTCRRRRLDAGRADRSHRIAHGSARHVHGCCSGKTLVFHRRPVTRWPRLADHPSRSGCRACRLGCSGGVGVDLLFTIVVIDAAARILGGRALTLMGYAILAGPTILVYTAITSAVLLAALEDDGWMLEGETA